MNESDLIDIDQTLVSEEIPSYQYVSLTDNKTYDVEIIVFAYTNKELPNYKTYHNKELFDDDNALLLQNKPEDVDFIQTQDSIEVTTEDNTISNNVNSLNEESDLIVSIEDTTEDKQILVWFQHEPETHTLLNIWNKLSQQDHIVPLIHQSWRQTETPFDNPTFVKLNNLPVQDEIDDENESLKNNNQMDNEILQDSNLIVEDSQQTFIDLNGAYLTQVELQKAQLNALEDYTIQGQVALSQGRFMHFGHNLNLIRHYFDENNEKQSMIFSLTERKQIKPDELHYFDSPWFGSLVKVTEYVGDEPNDDNNKDSSND